eukprot:Nitzschia sp. Nitz4//scaffold154_size52827//31257//31865//NITZ4_006779-RA/size52827-snap-gene-0.9-mRNA-1//-1//CDS//3329537317//122//frame0
MSTRTTASTMRLLKTIAQRAYPRAAARAAQTAAPRASLPQVRHFVAPQPDVNYDQLVKDTLKKMLSVPEENEVPVIEDEVLERRFKSFQNVFKEAELCIHDLKEATTEEEKKIEAACAAVAVDNAFRSYLDWLEDLRMANEEQVARHDDKSRWEYASKLKNLRIELSQVMKEV